MSRRATLAILDMRLRAESRVLAFCCAAAAVVGIVAPIGLAGPMLFCSLLGIIIALVQSPGRFPYLDLCEQGAPLFGRQLARARALVPSVIVALTTASYGAAAALAGGRETPIVLAATLGAAIPSTLTALCATIRRGPSRALYIGMAGAVAAAAFVLASVAHSLPGELAFAVLVSFLALRQYGEALARYDPV
jgi:hypothetical protein